MIVRRETPVDVAEARAVQVAAFRTQDANDEPVEARSTTIGVTAPKPAWGNDFQVRTLSTYRSESLGRFTYAAPFDEV